MTRLLVFNVAEGQPTRTGCSLHFTHTAGGNGPKPAAGGAGWDGDRGGKAIKAIKVAGIWLIALLQKVIALPPESDRLPHPF
jgi:hypothetical protein